MRNDNVTKFYCLRDYFLANGIVFQSSCVGTPQENGRVEKKYRDILDVAQPLRFQGKLSLYFWEECVLAASHLINRTPSSVLSNNVLMRFCLALFLLTASCVFLVHYVMLIISEPNVINLLVEVENVYLLDILLVKRAVTV